MGGRSGNFGNGSNDSARDGRGEGGWYELNVYRSSGRVSLSSSDLRSFSIRKGGVDWKYYGMNEEGWYFYETESKIHLPKDIVRCASNQFIQRKESLWVRGGGKGFEFGI
jgi:hypothetical protein